MGKSSKPGSAKGKVNAAKGLEKAIAAAFALLGQAPWITTITGVYPISLYQPSIYRGKELFLLVPIMVGVIATWAVVLSRKAMWVVFLAFLLVSSFVYWAYETFPPLSPIHPINWILSYCAFALC